MNINNPTTFGTPNLTFSTSNSSGSGGALRADDTVLIYDTTVPGTIASAASAATGSAATAARRDHQHGMYTATAAASAAEVTAASSTSVSITPGTARYATGQAKAFAATSAAGALLAGSYNVASVTDTGVGDRTLVFSVEFDDVLYIPLTGTQTGNSNFFRQNRNDAENLRIWVYNAANSAVEDQATVTAAWGTLSA